MEKHSLVPYRYNGTKWVAVDGYEIDSIENKVHIKSGHLSLFGLFAPYGEQNVQAQDGNPEDGLDGQPSDNTSEKNAGEDGALELIQNELGTCFIHCLFR